MAENVSSGTLSQAEIEEIERHNIGEELILQVICKQYLKKMQRTNTN